VRRVRRLRGAALSRRGTTASTTMISSVVSQLACNPNGQRKVLGLVEAGRPVVDVARDLRISGQSIYVWRRQ
jgi:hypothetical protein